MAKIELTENGLKLPAINAGDEIGISISESVEMADGAAYRVVVLGPIRGGGRALIAVSGKLQPSCRTGAISLQTTQARELFRPLLPTDSVPARVEVIDEQSGHFVAGSTTTLRNSFALWSGDAFPAQSFLSGDTFATLRAAIDAHEARRDNPHGVTAAQVGADAEGTAQILIDAHDGYPGAHPDIQQSIAGMDSVCRDYIADHNESQESHSDIRQMAEFAYDIAQRHIDDKSNPHAVTAEQVGADAAGTAQILIDTHDGYPGAHPDIQQSIANMDSVCRDYIADHNESQESHEDIRLLAGEAVYNANSAGELAINAISTAQGAVEMAKIHFENKENPHAVTAEQVGAITPQTAAEERHDYRGKTYHTKDEGVGLSLDWPMPAAFIIIDDDSNETVLMAVDTLFSNIGETTDTECEFRKTDFAILNKTNRNRRMVFETHDPIKCPSIVSFPYEFVVPANGGFASFRMNAFYYSGEQCAFEIYEEV